MSEQRISTANHVSSTWRNESLFCQDLPTVPCPEIGKILVTGASGYIGGRLLPELLRREYNVRVMARAASRKYDERWPGAEVAVADALNIDQLRRALEGVHTAYYLIHSLLRGPKQFAAKDLQAAQNFRKAAEDCEVKRIIYLGGLGDTRCHLSRHLRSRIEVAEELSRGRVPTTILRAAIIIGSGSASYEIIKHLVSVLPVILIPHWAENRCQPIAIRDVIKYLVGVMEEPGTIGKSFDIGGEEILTYETMLKIMAEVLHRKRLFVAFPYSNLGFYSYVGSLLTPVPAPITRCLVEGLKSDAICQNDSIKRFLPFTPISYKEAILRALTREEQDRIYTRWSDAYPPTHEVALKLDDLQGETRYKAVYTLVTTKPAKALFESVCSVGGKKGWFQRNWMWRLRGGVDRILLGVGSSRGRRSDSSLKINDVIDFWRVEDLQLNQRLLLRAEMKMPGKAWLEFTIRDIGAERRLCIVAYYDTISLFGKMYWLMFLPFHNFIFEDLLKQIEKRS